MSQGGQPNKFGNGTEKYQSSKPLLYYPEENHLPNEQACQDWNSRIMKHIMKGKM